MLKRITSLALVYVLLTVFAAPVQARELQKVNIGYFGVICELATYIAIEKGFFAEEGLEANLIKANWDGLKDGIASGKLDAVSNLLMNWLKPIEQGIDVKLTIGFHTGCLKLIASEKSGIKTIADLKGKRVGVNGIGGSAHLISYRAAHRAGLDPAKDIEWKAYSNPELRLALEKGEVDAVAGSDPATALIEKNVPSVTLIDIAVTPPFDKEFCCLLGINGKLVKNNPQLATKIARAHAKATKWISENRAETIDIIIDKNYVPIERELAAEVLQHYYYYPTVDAAKKALFEAAQELKDIGLLDKSTDPVKLASFAFVELEGLEEFKATPQYGKY